MVARRGTLAGVIGWLLLTACGGRGVPPVSSTGAGEIRPPSATPADVRYASTPLTPVATSLTRLLESALAGNTTPASIGVLFPSIAGTELRAAAAKPVGKVRPIAFLSRVHVRLKDAAPPREVVLGFLLTRTGLRVVQFEVRRIGKATRGATWKARGADEIASTLLARMRDADDDLSEWVPKANVPEGLPPDAVNALLPPNVAELRETLLEARIEHVELGDLALLFEDDEQARHLASFRPEPTPGATRLAIELLPVTEEDSTVATP